MTAHPASMPRPPTRLQTTLCNTTPQSACLPCLRLVATTNYSNSSHQLPPVRKLIAPPIDMLALAPADMHANPSHLCQHATSVTPTPTPSQLLCAAGAQSPGHSLLDGSPSLGTHQPCNLPTVYTNPRRSTPIALVHVCTALPATTHASSPSQPTHNPCPANMPH